MMLTVFNIYKHIPLLTILSCVVALQQENETVENICPLVSDVVSSALKESKELFSSDFWKNDDWEIKESNNLLSRPDFEDTFKEFVIKKQKEIIVNFEKSYSFSVKGTTDIEFFVSSESGQFYYPHQINDEKIWTTFTVSVKDGKLFFYENYTTLIQQVTTVPKTLTIGTPEPANFKIYDYEYKEATSDTKEQTYTNNLQFPGSQEVYLILSVSLCDTCVLIATYNNTNCFMYSSNDHNTERWASYKIKINPNIYKEAILTRRKHNSNNTGYWKLHLGLTNHSVEPVEKPICPLVSHVVSSPLKESKDLFSSDFWENDDWDIKGSNNLLSRPDFEDTFKEFVIKKRKEIFVNFEKSYSFSVNGTTDIEFFVSAESGQFYYPYQINDKKIWTTFTVSVKDGMLFIYENYTTLIQQVTNVPKTLTIGTPVPANFKIYDYEYKEATSDTKEQTYTNKLQIPGSEEVYLILSVSLCDSCSLLAIYNNTNCFIHSSNENNNERWERYKMKVNPKIQKEVTLSRLQRYPYNEGYWKLHLVLINHSIEPGNSTSWPYTPLTRTIIIIITAIIIASK
ncbi:uncharacterized protein LOC135138370 [Zophobas morio]|uniref:uncharacterized protein LOC135138370 n=1 Tax=Zophobas morio TaxID=2755281 RepID=UPI00308382C3